MKFNQSNISLHHTKVQKGKKKKKKKARPTILLSQKKKFKFQTQATKRTMVGKKKKKGT